MDLLERYLVLGLRLGRHIDGFVDAYYGPPELAAQVEAEDATPPAELAAEAAELAGEQRFADEHRDEWLRAQLAGCETTSRRLAGEPIAWADEVERCYGVWPQPVPEERLVQAQERLDAALPGDGDLAARYRSWVERQAVPGEKLLDAAARFDDLPVYSFAVPGLVAHEVYPGHHTEHAWKEALLVDGDGRLEETLFLTGTPQAVLSEGIAMLAPAVAFAGDEDAVAAGVYADLGIEYDAETAAVVRAFREALEGLSVNAAKLLHEEGRPRDEVRDYLQGWELSTAERAEKSIEFLTHPTWRAYVSCYSSGHDLCRRFVNGDVRRFRSLLTEQLTTRDLVAPS